MNREATPSPGERQVRPSGVVTAANIASVSRVPLAAVFALVSEPAVRVLVLAVAAATDLLDGWLARRVGPSKLGGMLDPVTDKVFMLTAFTVLALSRALTPAEIAGVLLRDILAPLGYVTSVVLRRPFAVPARAGGKAVTVGQSLTLCAWLLGSPLLRPLAWATGAIAIYAIADYGRLAVRSAENDPS